MGSRVVFGKDRAMTCARGDEATPWHFGRKKARGGAFVTHEPEPPQATPLAVLARWDIAYRFPRANRREYRQSLEIGAVPPRLTVGGAATSVAAMAWLHDSRLGRRISSPILTEDRIAAVRRHHRAQESFRVAATSERRSAGS